MIKVVVPLAVIGAVVLAVVPGKNPVKTEFQKEVHQVDHSLFVQYSEVHPTKATATSSLPGYPAMNLIDGASNTSWWSLPSAQGGVGQSIQLLIPGPSHIVRVGFLSGATETVQDYNMQARPMKIQMTFLGGLGQPVATVTTTLKDTSTFQQVAANTSGAYGLNIQILSVYPGDAGPSTSVAIAEIEPFTSS